MKEFLRKTNPGDSLPIEETKWGNFFLKILFIYSREKERERERGRGIGRGRSRLHALEARCGIRYRVSRIAPWAKGRRQTAAPPRDPS